MKKGNVREGGEYKEVKKEQKVQLWWDVEENRKCVIERNEEGDLKPCAGNSMFCPLV